MRVTLIGSGNVATVLGRKIFQSGHIIHQVYSRNIDHAKLLSDELSSNAIADSQSLDKTADLYIVAVHDDSLLKIGEWLQLNDSLIVHTAGSVPMDALINVSTNYGVLYPLQSLRKETAEPFIPVLVDGNNAWNKTRLSAFAQSFAGSVNFANDEERRKLHLVAVITNNFSNHLFNLVEDYCRKEEVDFKMILPLLEETVRRLSFDSAADLQTGPAVRNDQSTISNHKEMLGKHPELLRIYEEMTGMIGGREVSSEG
jgi:predicted dinucleotide-binding enzyme